MESNTLSNVEEGEQFSLECQSQQLKQDFLQIVQQSLPEERALIQEIVGYYEAKAPESGRSSEEDMDFYSLFHEVFCYFLTEPERRSWCLPYLKYLKLYEGQIKGYFQEDSTPFFDFEFVMRQFEEIYAQDDPGLWMKWFLQMTPCAQGSDIMNVVMDDESAYNIGLSDAFNIQIYVEAFLKMGKTLEDLDRVFDILSHCEWCDDSWVVLLEYLLKDEDEIGPVILEHLKKMPHENADGYVKSVIDHVSAGDRNAAQAYSTFRARIFERDGGDPMQRFIEDNMGDRELDKVFCEMAVKSPGVLMELAEQVSVFVQTGTDERDRGYRLVASLINYDCIERRDDFYSSLSTVCSDLSHQEHDQYFIEFSSQWRSLFEYSKSISVDRLPRLMKMLSHGFLSLFLIRRVSEYRSQHTSGSEVMFLYDVFSDIFDYEDFLRLEQIEPGRAITMIFEFSFIKTPEDAISHFLRLEPHLRDVLMSVEEMPDFIGRLVDIGERRLSGHEFDDNWRNLLQFVLERLRSYQMYFETILSFCPLEIESFHEVLAHYSLLQRLSADMNMKGAISRFSAPGISLDDQMEFFLLLEKRAEECVQIGNQLLSKVPGVSSPSVFRELFLSQFTSALAALDKASQGYTEKIRLEILQRQAVEDVQKKIYLMISHTVEGIPTPAEMAIGMNVLQQLEEKSFSEGVSDLDVSMEFLYQHRGLIGGLIRPQIDQFSSFREAQKGLMPVGAKVHTLSPMSEQRLHILQLILHFTQTPFQLLHANHSLNLPVCETSHELAYFLSLLQQWGVYTEERPELQITLAGRWSPDKAAFVGAGMLLGTKVATLYESGAFSTNRDSETGARLMAYDAGVRERRTRFRSDLPAATGRTDILGRRTVDDIPMYQLLGTLASHADYRGPFKDIWKKFERRMERILRKHDLWKPLWMSQWVYDRKPVSSGAHADNSAHEEMVHRFTEARLSAESRPRFGVWGEMQQVLDKTYKDFIMERDKYYS